MIAFASHRSSLPSHPEVLSSLHDHRPPLAHFAKHYLHLLLKLLYSPNGVTKMGKYKRERYTSYSMGCLNLEGEGVSRG